MFITDLSIRRPVVSAVFSMILVVFGLFVFWKLPVRELPSGLQPPVVQVQVDYEGASAEIIAHFGTLFSILLFYKASFFSSKHENDFFNQKTIKLLIISTIPAILFGLIFDFEQFLC